ncbi:MAG: putative sulfate exporter family transporter [Candidatus Bathyarchaeia archaeon]
MGKGSSTDLWSGVTFCAGIAIISFITSLMYKPISSLMWAFIYSIIITNLVELPEHLTAGINFCARSFLQGVIAALGIVTSALVWLQVGMGILNAIIIVFFSFFFGLWLGRKFGLSNSLATLIGVGTSICGASAIAATGPAINAKEEEMGLALAYITLFGLIAMFAYPFLYTSTVVGEWLQRNLYSYAIWVGSSIHEVAQVAAAGGALGVSGPALLVKAIRIFMIGPMILLATYFFKRKAELEDTNIRGKSKVVLPVYGIVFIILSFCCAFLDIYTPQTKYLGFDWIVVKSVLSEVVFKFLLALCFAGVGLKVKFRQIAKLGAKPLFVGALLAVLVGFLSLILAIFISPFIPKFS